MTIESRRRIALAMMVIAMGDVLAPTVVVALTTGPMQPEVQGFTPAEVESMVDLFSGDFSYNIPLAEVEGYPINLSYKAGIGPDQEASWVGLGWSLNPGAVERHLRGIPDDFKGDLVKRETYRKPNRSFGVSTGFGAEALGISSLSSGLTISPSFSNYEGVQYEIGVRVGMRATMRNKSVFNMGLGLSSHSSRGLRLQPEIGFGKEALIDKQSYTVGMNFGLAMDSRAGLTQASLGVSLDRTMPQQRRAGSAIEAGPSFDLGPPTYQPMIEVPMTTTSLSFNITTGTEAGVVHPNMRTGGFFNTSSQASREVEKRAFGYLFLGDGARNSNAMLDFNREKDGVYTEDQSSVGIAQLTNDVFTVTGQGASGSYRAFRSDIGHVFDASNSSTGAGGSGGLENGPGAQQHLGVDVIMNSSSSTSGDWIANNEVCTALQFRDSKPTPQEEMVYFKEANEPTMDQDPDLWDGMQGAEPKGFRFGSEPGNNARLQAMLTSDWSSGVSLPSRNYRTQREPRTRHFSYLTHKDAIHLGLDEVHQGHVDNASVKDHHMSEITVLQPDGGRYIYGRPLYNWEQEDVEFATEEEPEDGLVDFGQEDIVPGQNQNGRDKYVSRTTTPAYPYSFLLTAVVSPDYSDTDGERGPTAGDLGNYTKFTYIQAYDEFPWRTPVAGTPGDYQAKARFMRGRNSDPFDDRASFVRGKKEVCYLRAIESRNVYALFRTSADRQDARGVPYDLEDQTEYKQRRLETIEIWVKNPDFNVDAEGVVSGATLLKTVHFTYAANGLCPNTPNSGDGTKLTLHKVWTTYGESERGVVSPYVFTYYTEGADGPADYSLVAQDRWGVYKPESNGWTNDDFPYAEQDRGRANANSRAWNLKSIRLPSGGLISVDYEADDYAFVQDRPAMRMFRVTELEDDLEFSDGPGEGSIGIKFELPDDYDLSDVEAMVYGLDQLYFRFKVRMTSSSSDDDDSNFDYVSGYCELAEGDNYGIDDGDGIVRVKRVSLDGVDGGTENGVFPPHRAALEYLAVNYSDRSRNTFNYPADVLETGGTLAAVTQAITNQIDAIAGFVTGLFEFLVGPNQVMHERDKCREAIWESSYIRLLDARNAKIGGGHRVSQIRFCDSWAQMEDAEADEEYTYGQAYEYGNEEGSYGVATYEPMSGADENPFRRPVYGVTEKSLAPDQRFYQEEPFGESYFPSANVGYSKVIVYERYQDENTALSNQHVGRTVHEFYTSREFPTRVTKTILKPERRGDEPDLLALLGFKKHDHLHVSQGFTIETNDMHGKLKSIQVYSAVGGDPISREDHYYRTDQPDGTGRLVNRATALLPDGRSTEVELGRQYDMVADLREFASTNASMGVEYNADLPPVLSIPLPTAWPRLSVESTRFRVGALVKHVHRTGLLKKVERMENGSRVITEDLAYDSRTGSVLLRSVQNDFDDPYYALEVPAYWFYDHMGPAYRNHGSAKEDVVIGGGSMAFSNAMDWFVAGDELAVRSTGGDFVGRAWADKVEANRVRLVDEEGDPTTWNGTYDVSIVRSGRRNQLQERMMKITTYDNPLQGLTSNVFSRVVDASCVEFANNWPADCECLDPQPGQKTNSWRNNTRSVWRLSKEWVWLTERMRSVDNGNSNIRRDGVYASFAPLYRSVAGGWSMVPSGWTSARQVMAYDRSGKELEQRDALGIYSSALFGHQGTLVKAVARNARYREIGFASFEDMDADDCSKDHLAFSSAAEITDAYAHTGRRSIRVVAGTTVELEDPEPWVCPCPTDIRVQLKALSLGSAGPNWMVIVENAVPPLSFSALPAVDAPLFHMVSEADPLWTVVQTSPALEDPLGAVFRCDQCWPLTVLVRDGNGCTTQIAVPQP